MINARFKRTNSFEKTFLNRSSYAHYFPSGFHLGIKRIFSGRELVKRKSREFRNNIIESRLKRGGSIGNHYLVKRHTNSYLSRYSGDRITARLRSESGGTRDSRIYFYKIILERIGVKSELNVTAPLDFEFSYYFQSAVPEHMILFIRQRLRRTYNY